MKPRTDRQKLVDKLDALWRQLVKERDFHRCQICKQQGTEAHHIMSRKNLSTRWDLDNGITLCRECHTKAHADKYWFALQMTWGFTFRYNELKDKSKVILHLKNHDLEDMLKALKNG